MDKISEIYCDTSSDSVLEIEPLKKLPPPLIDLETEQIILNKEKTPSHVVMTPNISGDGNFPDKTPEEYPDDSPNHWTKDMKKFYNEDWGNEEKFIVDKLQEKMEKHPILWTISQKDMFFKLNRKKKSRAKCCNCYQYGHSEYKCPSPKRIVKCHMCGEAGHNVDFCPNAKCLNCGNETMSYVLWCNKCKEETYKQCTRCSLLGHYFINCSDNWRRYHSAVGKTEIDVTEITFYKPESEMWCCNCGRKGHNQILCPREKVRHFPETLQFVASYDGSTCNQYRLHGVKRSMYCEPSSSKCKRRKMQHYSKKSRKCNNPKMTDYINLHTHSKKKKKRKKGKSEPSRKLIETPNFIPV